MGKTIDCLLGKGFKTSKFKSLVELVSSKIAALEKQHRLRRMQSLSDVVALLKLHHQESALLRVELVIAEQNILDAYAMIENFCFLLFERAVLIESNRECPEELKEAISSLIFAASKCGELHELGTISRMFTKRYGKEFANNAVNLCNNCGVCPKIISKLSTQRPSQESKLTMLKEIALANEIDLHIEGYRDQSHQATEETRIGTEDRCKTRHDIDDRVSVEKNECEKSPEEVLGTRRYEDFKLAARTAYRLAERAAVAASVAVELSQPLDGDRDRTMKSTDEKHLTHHYDDLEDPESDRFIDTCPSFRLYVKIETDQEGHQKRD